MTQERIKYMREIVAGKHRDAWWGGDDEWAEMVLTELLKECLDEIDRILPTPALTPAEHFYFCGMCCVHVNLCRRCADSFSFCEEHVNDPRGSFTWREERTP